MNDRRQRRRILVLVALFCLVVLLLEVIPRTSEAVESAGEWIDIRSERVAPASFEAERTLLEQERERLHQRMDDDAPHELTSENQLTGVLGALRVAAEETGADLVKIEPGESVTDEFGTRIPVSVVVTGSGHTVAGFVDHVERAAELIQIVGLDATGPGLVGGGTTETAMELFAIRRTGR